MADFPEVTARSGRTRWSITNSSIRNCCLNRYSSSLLRRKSRVKAAPNSRRCQIAPLIPAIAMDRSGPAFHTDRSMMCGGLAFDCEGPRPRILLLTACDRQSSPVTNGEWLRVHRGRAGLSRCSATWLSWLGRGVLRTEHIGNPLYTGTDQESAMGGIRIGGQINESRSVRASQNNQSPTESRLPMPHGLASVCRPKREWEGGRPVKACRIAARSEGMDRQRLSSLSRFQTTAGRVAKYNGEGSMSGQSS